MRRRSSKTGSVKFPVLIGFIVAFLCAAPSGGFAQSYGLVSRPNVGAYLDGTLPTTAPAVPSTYSTVVAFPYISFQNCLGLLPLPGTNSLVVWEREGRIYSFVNSPSTTAKTLMLDLSNQCQGWDDCGLLGFAFHPNFATNHYFYVWYNWVAPGTVQGSSTVRPPNNTSSHQRLARFTYNPATGTVDPASEFIVIDQIDHNTYHNGGGMFFHPLNGFLYLTNGYDNDPSNNQIINKGFFGCLLRIDVDKRGGSISHAPTTRAFEEVSPNWPQYYVPNSNPFVGVPGTLEEIYGLGLRSPHRMTYDAPSNRIFIGDVGDETKEEIDVIEPTDPGGLNFQYDQFEGYGGDMTPPYLGLNKRPMLDYRHDTDGSAVIGGYVYRGPSIPALAGKYLFADNVTNRIWSLDESTHTATTPASKVYLATMPKGAGPNSGRDYTGISSWGYDAQGELYLCQLSSLGGYIFKLKGSGGIAGGSQPLPATLSQTGIFSDLPSLTPSAKFIPYSPNAPFWSDGAIKSRWAAIPTSATVGFAPTGQWTFPGGSVFVKHFDLASDDTNVAARRRLETRVLVTNGAGAYGATYKWREDNSDADLLTDAGLTESIPIVTANSIGTLTSLDIGAPPGAGSTSRVGDDVTIVAGGNDVWGNTDQFTFAYLQRAGDFDVRMRVVSLTNTNTYTKVGLMARGSLAANSKYAYSIAYPPANGRACDFEYRTNDGDSANLFPAIMPGTAFPRWMRLQRQGNVFISFTSLDGTLWTEIGRMTIAMAGTAYLGVAECAGNGNTVSTTRATASVHLEHDTRFQTWSYPSRNDCMTCHNAAAGSVLGLNTRQLNGNLTYPSSGVTDNQVRAWNHVGIFSNPPQESAIPTMDKLSVPGDNTVTLQQRARSYVDVNCAYCHQPGGTTAYWDARYDTPILQQAIINGQLGNTLGITGAKVVKPQNVALSGLYSRVNLLGQYQMPPLARNQIDAAGVTMLSQWINSLPVTILGGETNGKTYLNTDPFTMTGGVTAGAGKLSRVEYWDNGALLGTSTAPPWNLTPARTLSAGTHQLTSIVYDSLGAASPSLPVTVIIIPLRLDLTGFKNGYPQLQTLLPGGRNYSIDYTSDLTNWQTLSSGVATGPLIQLQDTTPGTQKSYRLRAWQ